jgi:zinc protease
LSHNRIGDEKSVENITIDDLKSYFTLNGSPTISLFQIVGAVPKNNVIQSLTILNKEWKSKVVTFPKMPATNTIASSKIYFYDVPGAKQSVIRIGYPALAATDADFYSATILNYRLGGGGFASQLTQQLREGKGYTYGIGSSFSGSNNKGPFSIASGVRSNITFESVSLIKEILNDYGKNYSENDLDVTKGYLIKSNARAFETLEAKLGMLYNISNYNYADTYAKQQEDIVKNSTTADIKRLSEKYLNADKMIYLIVGDAETQLGKLQQIGFGKPILLNESAVK